MLLLYLLSPALVMTQPKIYPRSTRTVFEAACGKHIFRAAYRRRSSSSKPMPDLASDGNIDFVTIDDKVVANAAEALRIRVARRAISTVGIMHCGWDENKPSFQGVLETLLFDSERFGLNPNIYFRIQFENGSWRFVLNSITQD